MKQARWSISRGVAAVSVAALLIIAPAAGPRAHAQTGGPGIQFAGYVSAVPAATPTTNIVQAGTRPPTYSPNYLPNCMLTGNPAFVIVNKTTASQSVTNLPNQTVIATIPAGQSAGFTVSGTSPGFVLAGLASNHHTALVVYCS